jgi:phosphohistidine phosphatase SixA
LLLPGAEPLQLFRELARDKDLSAVFIFGHAPHLDDILATSIGSRHHITALKKAGVALVELKRLVPPSGSLLWLATPKLLRKAAK